MRTGESPGMPESVWGIGEERLVCFWRKAAAGCAYVQSAGTHSLCQRRGLPYCVGTQTGWSTGQAAALPAGENVSQPLQNACFPIHHYLYKGAYVFTPVHLCVGWCVCKQDCVKTTGLIYTKLQVREEPIKSWCGEMDPENHLNFSNMAR